MYHVLKVHEDLLKTYEQLGMQDFVEKEKERIRIIKEYHHIDTVEVQQLEIPF